MDTTPATELDAVNVILVNMSETPVDTLSGDLPLDALKAQDVLTEISRTVQTRGWFWNREVSTLSLNTENKIPVPSNVLEVKRTKRWKPQITLRDGLLYRIERNNNGYTFEDAEEVELTYFLPFEELPESAKRYITIRAARIYEAREIGDQVLMQNASVEEQDAWAILRAEDNANSGRNLGKTKSMAMITDRNGAVRI